MTPPDDDRALSRRDLLRHGAEGAALLSSGAFLAACGGSSKSTPTATPAAQTTAATPKRGGTLRVGVVTNGNAETLDVRKAINTPDYLRTDNLYDPLFFQVVGGVAPGLATAAEPNKDGTKWTLKLRPGVHWHDGKPFTADDVVYTINSWNSPASYFQPLASSIIDFKGVRALDAHTVEVPLIKPAAEFPTILSWYNGYVVQNGTKNFNKPIGTGPFRYESFTPGSSSTFTANPDYWRGKPFVDRLVVDSSFTADPARLNALLSGALDIAPGVPPALAKANASSGRLVLGNSPGPGFIAITMRLDQAPFTDPRVVQAFKLLTDRNAFVNQVFDGYATPGNDSIGATLKYWDSSLKATYDPEKAKSLLKAAGHENLSMTLLASPVVPGMVESGTLWAEQAAKVGVKANLKQLSPSVYYTSANPGYLTSQRPLSVNYWNVLPPSLAGFYLEALNAKAPFNETTWGKGSGQDKLFNEALAEMDPTKAAEKWQAVQQQQASEGGYAVVANNNYLDAYAKNVQGVKTSSAGNASNYDFHAAWLS
jgi:peptide/nickel transport system substrate-binding protein